MTEKEKRQERTRWMMNDRFGMFIHFGLYSIPARGEWVRSYEAISVEDYEQYFNSFDPIDYDPKKWAQLAKKAGMKYAVMTTKHHDGFCLFDSQYTDYKATNTPAGRDLIKEYVDAFRQEGIKVGLYYSLLDWHHPDFPAYEDEHHPMRGKEEYKHQNGEHFERYIEYYHAQVRELLTNYGKIDLLWFDFSYGEMSGEKWGATRLMEMVRELQPDIIIDNRLGGHIKADHPEIYAGDYISPEQIIPPRCITDSSGEALAWEACITLNGGWGYSSCDHNYKHTRDVIHLLIECVSKGGNLLLNVGPDAKGNIPPESVNILTEVGQWMEKNAASVYGCGAADYPKPEWGRLTQKGNKLYAHVYECSLGIVVINDVDKKVKQARLLHDGSEADITPPWFAFHYEAGSHIFINLKSSRLPHEPVTVVELLLEE